METRNLRQRRQEYGLFEQELDENLNQKRFSSSGFPVKSKILYFVLIASIFALALLVGKIYTGPNQPIDQDEISKMLMANLNVDNIKKYLREFTKKPHVAGTEANLKVAQAIARIWKENGLENVHFNSYEVLLNYPVWDKPNTLKIHKDSVILFETNGIEPVIFPGEQGDKDAGIQWLAWSPPGKVTGDIVFCNEARDTDFKKLHDFGISLKDRIALIRYGTGFRGDKVRRAQEQGAAAVLLYSDPMEVAADGIQPENIYPHTAWMPLEGVQRGSVIHGMNGDPLSPIFPSKPGLYKMRDIEKAKFEGVLPSIPVLPISYSSAFEIMKRMDGPKAPPEWQGGLNLEYKLGPGLIEGAKTTVEVRSVFETRKINNVFGYIRGSEEPDRFVILGNHYDAWAYGSLDPNSGTAILAEMANSFTKTMKEIGWRPVRTIVFAAWDAEEYSLIGSTEFVEEYLQTIQQRVVTYINMDCIHDNKTLTLATSPSLYRAVISSAKKVPNPNKDEVKEGRLTLYDTWYHYYPDSIYKERPWMKIPSGNSDQAPFQNFAGIPVIDFAFKNNSPIDYPLYHSMYETPYLNEHLVDWDNFAIHLATGQLWIEMARVFSESTILPIDHFALAKAILADYIPPVKEAVNSIKPFDDSMEVKEISQVLHDQIRYLQEAALDFKNAVNDFASKFWKDLDLLSRRSINDRIMGVDRCFIDPQGSPGAPQSRHVLFSVSDKDSYSARVMASVFDSISSMTMTDTREVYIRGGKLTAEQISIVQYSLFCATNMMKDHF